MESIKVVFFKNKLTWNKRAGCHKPCVLLSLLYKSQRWPKTQCLLSLRLSPDPLQLPPSPRWDPPHSGLETNTSRHLPDVGVPLHVQVVEIVGALRPAKVGSLQPLDDLSFHHPSDVSRQQREQQALLRGRGGRGVKAREREEEKQQEMPRSRVSGNKAHKDDDVRLVLVENMFSVDWVSGQSCYLFICFVFWTWNTLINKNLLSF